MDPKDAYEQGQELIQAALKAGYVPDRVDR